MRLCATTGSTVPGWVRERVALWEAAWPLWVLSAALAGLCLFQVVLLGVLWTSDACVYYAPP